ncbi:MAG: tetraacyldisaccharide 4'-kinase [Elusimicrobia bacterium RIFOXYA12_FULL_51_18]|nr:MAG: tetraacyldisaccharide 4'-kinase [Elusimicrobia bacterium RIFOXYA12_FULL_51_18]OGS29959.1 MAG: tetraacyldisaccharide 4'-kinase [Elusimicrobia bacterium RIFOXYA2_FULL_53_38]
MEAKKIRDTLKEKALGRLLLRLLSLLYISAVVLRRILYGFGLLKSYKLPVPVICFGNLSSGGTGKTSTVVMAAIELKKKGYRPAILIRGYKRNASGNKLTILSEGEAFSAEEAGDEALMLFKMLRDYEVPVLVASDRYQSGLAALEKFKSDILLMDDGYQFFRLQRDINVALINTAMPFHKDDLLPLGDLRETPSGLDRADAIILSHCEHASEAAIKSIREKIKKITPSADVLESMHSPEIFLNALSKEKVPLSEFQGKSVVTLSGIGDPKSFEDTLVSLKAVPVQIWRYPDHHQFTREELAAIQSTRANMPLITTFKDFARFPPDWAQILEGGVFILSVKIVFSRDGHEQLMKTITSVKHL